MLFHSNPWLTKWPKFHVLGILIDSGETITLDFLRKFFSQEYNFLAMYGNQKNNNTSNSCMMMLMQRKWSLYSSVRQLGISLTVLKPFLRNHIYLIVCYYYVFEKKSFKNRKKSTSHTNTNYASICNCWVNLLTILIFYSYYDLIDKVLPYFWSVIINNYIYFN